MNFLAHLYLSGEDEHVRLGNFFADAVKGNALKKYPDKVRAGISLHRHIDGYTDSHLVVKKSIKRLQPRYRKYSGIVVDLYYDHYLAANWNEYSATPLKMYAREAYKLLLRNYFLLPDRSKRILPFLITYNWLEGYSTLAGLQQVFNGMARRTRFPEMKNAIHELKLHYHKFDEEFKTFFPAVIDSSRTYLEDLLSSIE